MAGSFSDLKNLKRLFFGTGDPLTMRERTVPEKEESPQGVRPIRDSDTSTVTQIGYIGNIPTTVLEMLEHEIRGVEHGGVSLIVNIRNGHPTFRIEKTISIMTGA